MAIITMQPLPSKVRQECNYTSPHWHWWQKLDLNRTNWLPSVRRYSSGTARGAPWSRSQTRVRCPPRLRAAAPWCGRWRAAVTRATTPRRTPRERPHRAPGVGPGDNFIMWEDSNNMTEKTMRFFTRWSIYPNIDCYHFFMNEES